MVSTDSCYLHRNVLARVIQLSVASISMVVASTSMVVARSREEEVKASAEDLKKKSCKYNKSEREAISHSRLLASGFTVQIGFPFSFVKLTGFL